MFSSSVHPLTLSQRDKTSVILLWLTPGNFTRQTENSHQERVNLNDNGILLKIHSASQNVNRKRRYLNINTHTQIYMCMYVCVCMCVCVCVCIYWKNDVALPKREEIDRNRLKFRSKPAGVFVA